MDYIKLDKKAIASWRIGRVLSFAILFLACAALRIISGRIPQLDPFLWIITLALSVIVLYKLLGILIYPMIEYRQWGYYITEDKVDIHHGIFFVTNTIVPIIRIQHITVSQGPINRRLGLYDVELSLASDNFKIECLAKDVADEIAENLKNKLYTRLKTKEEGQ